jgi:hypothetical protein
MLILLTVLYLHGIDHDDPNSDGRPTGCPNRCSSP